MGRTILGQTDAAKPFGNWHQSRYNYNMMLIREGVEAQGKRSDATEFFLLRRRFPGQLRSADVFLEPMQGNVMQHCLRQK
jgi:hypothetical protein